VSATQAVAARVHHLHNKEELRDDVRQARDRPVDRSCPAKQPLVNTLTIHLYAAFVVAALAVLAVWRRPERRITLYVVTLQIVIGVVLMVQGGRVVPWYHPALAVLGWIGYMAANAIARRDPASRNALVISAVSSLLILIAYYIGIEAVKHGVAG
jgi:hypothetical protein